MFPQSRRAAMAAMAAGSMLVAMTLPATDPPESAGLAASHLARGAGAARSTPQVAPDADQGRWPCPNAACLIPTVLCDDTISTSCNPAAGVVTISGVPIPYGSWKHVVYKEEVIRRLATQTCPPGYFNSTSHCYEEQYWTGPACNGTLVHVKPLGQRPTGTLCPTRPTPVPARPAEARASAPSLVRDGGPAPLQSPIDGAST